MPLSQLKSFHQASKRHGWINRKAIMGQDETGMGTLGEHFKRED
jgi:hypothetical protein